MSIYMERNGRKEYTREEIAKALADLQSCEGGDIYGQGEAVTYFLHMDDEGNILTDKDDQDACFIYTINMDDYEASEEDLENYGVAEDGSFNWWDSRFLPDHETLGWDRFADAVDSLTEEANAFLKEIMED